jgi:hypothetical protein
MSQEKEEKPVKSKKEELRNNIILTVIALVLVGALVALVVVPKYLTEKEAENNEYNHFPFQMRQGSWYTVIESETQRAPIPFYYHPRELENIPLDPNVLARFNEVQKNNGSIFITIDPESPDNDIVIAGVEISKVTGQWFAIPTASAVIRKPEGVDTEFPVLTCADADNDTLIIWLTKSDKNVAYAHKDCVILEGKTYEDLIKVADRLSYSLLGIMN